MYFVVQQRYVRGTFKVPRTLINELDNNLFFVHTVGFVNLPKISRVTEGGRLN